MSWVIAPQSLGARRGAPRPDEAALRRALERVHTLFRRQARTSIQNLCSGDIKVADVHIVRSAAPSGAMSVPAPLEGGMLTIGRHFVADEDLKCVIFDVDGTLVDAMPWYQPSWGVVSRKFGVDASAEVIYSLAGQSMPDISRTLWANAYAAAAYGFDTPQPTDEWINRFLQAYADDILVHESKVGPPPPIDCMVELARNYSAQGMRLAAASGGTCDMVTKHLASLGLQSLFGEHVVCATDVPNSKPAPDVYLEAARGLGLGASKCRCLDDGELGLESAYRAGCHVVDVTYHRAYPMNAALALTKKLDALSRTWLPAEEQAETLARARHAAAQWAQPGGLEAWYESWVVKLEEWWLTVAPATIKQNVAGCFGALGLHLASRWEALLGRGGGGRAATSSKG